MVYLNNAIDITQLIIDTINNIFSSIFSSIDNNLYSILDYITFIDEDIITTSYFKTLFGTSVSNGILLISNSLLIGFLLFFSVKLILSHLGITQSESPISFIFKLIFFGLLMNASLFICEKILFFNSQISLAIRMLGEELFHSEISFSNLVQLLNSAIYIENTSINVFSIDGILKTFTSVGFLNLAFTYAIRYVMVKVFILISPFAFLSLCTHSTSSFFKAWFKAFISLVLVQILISLILVLTFSLDINSNSILPKLLICGSIFSLSKANSYIRSLFGGISVDFSNGINGIKSLMKGG